MTPTLFSSRAVAAALLLASLGGCELLKHDQEAIAVINARIVGMPVGEFFDRYGRADSHDTLPDGSSEYLWASQPAFARPGPESFDDQICRMRLTVDKRGRIGGTTVLFDAPGKKSVSRCGEIFAAK